MLQAGATVVLLIGLVIGYFSWTSLIVSGFLEEVSNPPKEIYLSALRICYRDRGGD